MSLTDKDENNSSWKARIQRLPPWVRGGLVGALLFILISLAFGVAYWVTEERWLNAPIYALFNLGLPPLLFVIIGAVVGSGRRNLMTVGLVFFLLGLLSIVCISGLYLGLLSVYGYRAEPDSLTNGFAIRLNVASFFNCSKFKIRL